MTAESAASTVLMFPSFNLASVELGPGIFLEIYLGLLLTHQFLLMLRYPKGRYPSRSSGVLRGGADAPPSGKGAHGESSHLLAIIIDLQE